MNFKKRINGSWTDTPNYIHNTFTDTITTLPADIYPTGTTATVGLKGNMEQNGTPTPTTPIQPQETGDLETVGDKAGQYKIPISSANTTTPIYLGEVETTRRIKKLVLTGEENWIQTVSSLKVYRTNIPGYLREMVNIPISTHYKGIAPVIGAEGLKDLETTFLLSSSGNNYYYIRDDRFNKANDFKSYLQQQYTAGTPVIIWYVLATPETAVVNEPLRKIGDYADEVSGITIPTIAGANTIDVDTTLKPSEVSVNYHGWHPVIDVHEAENGQWD